MNDYKCADCGCFINEGEFKTFGVCDDCWDAHHKKQTAMTQSDAPNEGREHKTEQDWQDGINDEFVNGPSRPHGYTHGPKVPMQWPSRTEPPNHSEKLEAEIKGLRDQLSKEREKHDAEIKRIQASCNQAIKDVKMDYDAYAAEREMRKELVENLQQYLCLFDEGGQIHQEIESLIAKASELDKIKT